MADPPASRPSLGSRLRLQFLLLGVLPVLAVVAASWWLLAPVLVEQAETRNRELALAVRDQVALQLELREQAAHVLADAVSGRAPPDVQRALDAIVRADRFLQGAFAVDASGRVVAAALAGGAARNRDDTIGLDLTGQPHVARARSERQPVWSDAFLSTLTGGLTAALAVPSGDGLVVLELSVAALSKSVGDLAQNGGSRVAIVDRAGRVIAHPDERQAREQASLQTLAPVRDALAGREAGARLAGPHGGELVQALPVVPIGWAVVVARPVSTVMAPLRRAGAAVSVLLALTIASAMAVGWLMARRTGREVALLAEGARRAAEARDPPTLEFTSAEFEAVWQRLRELFVQVTAQHEETRAAQRELQAVLDAATQVAIIATDQAGAVQVFNVGAQRLLGWSESEVVGRLTPLAWMDGDEVAERADALGREHGLAITGFDAVVFESRRRGSEVRDWRLVRRDGSALAVSMAVTAMQAPGDGLKGFLLVATDITERRRAEQLELARQSAEAASRAKSDFLSRMSHELRTPLNAMLGYAQLLDAEVEAPVTPRQHERLQQIQRSGWYLLRLIEDVLDLARIEAGGLRVALVPTSLGPVFEKSTQIVQPLMQRQVTLTMELGDDVPRVVGDETRLVQVLVNLLGNAIKYNRAQGTVRLSAHAAPQGVRITVADTGPGMTPDQLAHLYEPFNRLGRERSGIEGTGIGLVITRHLVEMMNGRMEVQSEPGRGTTIHLTLPQVENGLQSQEVPATSPAESLPGPGTARGRVLYIEDNPVNAELMRAILHQRPEVELEVSADARSGLEAARRDWPDLVLLDMHLPDADGESVFAALRAEPAGMALPIVVVSADATQEHLATMRALGARHYLTKPLDLAATLRVVDEVLSPDGADAAHV